MSRYIDKDAFVKSIKPIVGEMSFGMQCDIANALVSAPSINIVFCEKCKKSKIGHSNGEFYRWCSPNIKRVKDNDFCSDGKMRDE